MIITEVVTGVLLVLVATVSMACCDVYGMATLLRNDHEVTAMLWVDTHLVCGGWMVLPLLRFGGMTRLECEALLKHKVT